MVNETRNQLLQLLSIAKENKEIKDGYKLDWLLESFERDINNQLKDIKYKEQQLKDNLELLDYVRTELEKESD